MAYQLDRSRGHMHAEGPSLRQFLFACVSMLIVLIIIYGNSFHASWHYDDFTNIVDNGNVHMDTLSWRQIKQVIYKDKPGREYNNRPFAYLTFAVNHYISGLDVVSYHVLNFLIHLFASVFLYLFVFRTMNLPSVQQNRAYDAHSVALLSAFLWATHPIQVTAVTYIVQRMASMAGLFYIMAMYCYLRARISMRGKNAWYTACGLSACVSFMTKENAAMLPFSILLYDHFLLRDASGNKQLPAQMKRWLLPVCVLVILSIVYIDLSALFDGYKNRPFTPVERLLTQPRVILFYLSLLVYPLSTRLALLHDVDISTGLFTPWTTLPSILLLAGLLLALLVAAKRHPLVSFCGIFFLMNHAIEGTIFNLELVYEHRNYLPSFFFFVMVSLGLWRATDYFSHSRLLRKLIWLGLSVVMITNAHTVYVRNQTLHTDGTLWQDQAAKTPGLSVVHNNLGRFFWTAGQPSKAIEAYRRSLSLNHFMNLSQVGIVHFNIGLYHAYETKDYQQAVTHFHDALADIDGRPDVWAETARVNLILGHRRKALEQLQFALKFWPNHPDLLKGLCLVRYKAGQLEEAWWTALGIYHMMMPDKDGGILPVLAEIARQKGDKERAIRYWRAFLKDKPEHIRGTLALIELAAQTGNDRLLDQLIGRLIYLKKGKSFQEIVNDTRTSSNISAYIPRASAILPLIRRYLAEQIDSADADTLNELYTAGTAGALSD